MPGRADNNVHLGRLGSKAAGRSIKTEKLCRKFVRLAYRFKTKMPSVRKGEDKGEIEDDARVGNYFDFE